MSDARDSITNLVYAYAERIDAGDFEGIGALFEYGALSAEGSAHIARGAEEVTAQFRDTTRIYPDTGTPKNKHVTTNLTVDADEAAGTGTCRSYFTVFQQTENLPLQPIICGRYRDEFERKDGNWRFARRHIICDLFGNLSRHLLIDLGELRAGKNTPNEG